MVNNKNPNHSKLWSIFKPQTETDRSRLRSIELSSSNKNPKTHKLNGIFKPQTENNIELSSSNKIKNKK